MARDWWRTALAASAAVALAVVCAFGGHVHAKGAKGHDPAEAQRAIDAAASLLDAGKVDRAVRSLTATLTGGNLPPPVLAKAFYVRGLAYRRQSKPAQAISDLTAALWLKGGLGGEERADALRQRTAAYADAGLTESGSARASKTAAREPAEKAGGNWLSNIFGAPPTDPPPGRPPQVTGTTEKSERPVAAKAPRPIGGWGSATEVREADRVARRAPAAPEPEPEARPAGGGGYQVQVAAVRTKAQALALAAKAKREHAVVLAASRPVIDRAVLGNMGSFYRVRFGPFASAGQTQAVCAELKGSGLDCMTVRP